MKKILYTMTALFMLSAIGAEAQVNIGSLAEPQSFSLLELEGGGTRGLRLPQLDSDQRDALDFTGHETEALGLQIFNTTTKCVETWNGVEWIMQCDCGDHPCPEPTGANWETTKWVGAFWRDDQTGERVIASKVSDASVTWTASVDEENGGGAWLTLDGYVFSDPGLWIDNPGNAENYQLPATRKTSVNGKGNILFRIGALSKNTQTDNSYDTKIKPRYAKVILTINNTPYTIYCRQGHSADYVFRKSDNAAGTLNSTRNLAAKFSPYNLTNELINETTTAATTGVATSGTYNGEFVKYPTQVGAFFQWAGPSGKETFAYHPTATINNGNWKDNYSSGYWSALGATHETCPVNWRRPTVGAINNNHTSQVSSGSELMQSLFEVPFDGADYNRHSDNHRYFGYYADGYFDRRAITASASTQSSSAVSKDTKDAAYIGVLYTNPATNASLFAPAGGYRIHSSGSLLYSGNSGYYWSSSSYDSSNGCNDWYLYFGSSNAYQYYNSRNNGLAVRCVKEDLVP
ncbi:MAG: hypothetical protein LBJ17_09540 [Dysgonamonadaceae bacterium]|jgi:hypothetical protein|nr:hypothetical protein [Dysgonamonadaceae bacterium]